MRKVAQGSLVIIASPIMGPRTPLLGSANALVKFITLVKLAQHRRSEIGPSSGSAVMRHVEQQG